MPSLNFKRSLLLFSLVFSPNIHITLYEVCPESIEPIFLYPRPVSIYDLVVVRSYRLDVLVRERRAFVYSVFLMTGKIDQGICINFCFNLSKTRSETIDATDEELREKVYE